MKKRDRKKLNDKVILFPDLEKRLLEKGLEKMQQKRFREATEHLEEAIRLDPENSDIHIGLVLAYFEWGSLQKAKEIAASMLQKGIGEYIQIIDLYLMILVQLHQYEEIVTTIEILLEEKEIPTEKYENFTRMLEFSRRMAEEKPEKEAKEEAALVELDKDLDLFALKTQQEQVNMAAKLAERNIRSYVGEINTYLQSKEGSPFFKTMLLNVLIEHDYDKEVTVEKLGRKLSVIPFQLPPIHKQPETELLLNVLSSQIEHEDPILFENIKSLINRHSFILYPFQLETYKENVWAAAYHTLVAEYLGSAMDEDLLMRYQVEIEELKAALLELRQLEEISSSDF
ncbi:tetratricopeptide repeat protein [Cytobacillus massiliigabonensis]|uniref:tetratricopeptide repeat protein n=1 Tax=Cytobacillus massiliigabonensis TaxID=1871011 RepID=UPI000C82B4AF|nr:tetratricopeptide repeat protein [Cytobacillus massiliigabonensis]